MASIVVTGDTSGAITIAAPAVAGTNTLTLPASTGTLVVTGGAQTIEFADGSAAAPSITNSGDTNTGMFFPAADTIAFTEGGTESMRIDSSGRVGIGTSSPTAPLTIVNSAVGEVFRMTSVGTNVYGAASDGTIGVYTGGVLSSTGGFVGTSSNHPYVFRTNDTERMRIDSSGNLLVGKTSNDFNSQGVQCQNNGELLATRNGTLLSVNRLTTDGVLVDFYQAGTSEGNISVSGSTVSYNGGHLSRYAQTLTPKDNSLLKGTVLSNLDEMNEYLDAEGNLVDNEQLNKVKVSDVEGDVNVAGVFVNWSHDETHNVDEINMAMTGDMIIRIAQGVVVQKGDLLMSAGDGTAKPQGDDIVRSKTIAKVTSNHVTCTYEDGSYCVPCVLMAC